MRGWISFLVEWVFGPEDQYTQEQLDIVVPSPITVGQIQATVDRLLPLIANLDKYPRLKQWLKDNIPSFTWSPYAIFRE